MSEVRGDDAQAPWQGGVVLDFTRSELFERTFEEGMELVEETAAYLDGAGRQDSKLLSRTGALAYASESMRLTTRLMQVASWLLVQRAVREGDMNPADACEERYRLGAHEISENRAAEGIEELPNGLLTLLDRSERLYDRIRHLDRRMYVDQTGEPEPHPLQSQMDRLQAAFGR
ncbi:MAG: regulator of CtrA degradation rcdA [Caulobacteraceae bacterium]|nr:regulator of CtrA degradation rcdA [Caulobacteraceae bacterium]